MAVLAPMPSPSVSTATDVKSGARSNRRVTRLSRVLKSRMIPYLDGRRAPPVRFRARSLGAEITDSGAPDWHIRRGR